MADARPAHSPASCSFPTTVRRPRRGKALAFDPSPEAPQRTTPNRVPALFHFRGPSPMPSEALASRECSPETSGRNSHRLEGLEFADLKGARPPNKPARPRSFRERIVARPLLKPREQLPTQTGQLLYRASS